MPVFLPGKFHGQRHLAGYSPWGCQESDTTEHVCGSSCPGTLGPEALSAGPRLRGRGPARTSERNWDFSRSALTLHHSVEKARTL